MCWFHICFAFGFHNFSGEFLSPSVAAVIGIGLAGRETECYQGVNAEDNEQLDPYFVLLILDMVASCARSSATWEQTECIRLQRSIGRRYSAEAL